METETTYFNMTLLDLLKEAVDGTISYADAKEQLKKLISDYDAREQYDILIKKIIGTSREEKNTLYYTNCIPNEYYYDILQDTIELVRNGEYTPQIVQKIFDTYRLGPETLNYFINEAISIVRMNNLSPEEIASLGEAYHVVASRLEAQGIKQKPKIQLQGQTPINAEELSEIDVEEIEE